MSSSRKDVFRLGRYELVEHIATGGTADVWLARVSGSEGFRKKVVVKILRGHLATDATLVDMFINEARLAAELNHPHIVQVFDFGRIGNRFFLAMEFVAGATLRKIHRKLVSRRMLMPVALVVSTLANVCEALSYAYELRDDNGKALRIVHRDVTPENIMLTYAGATKVLDFGIAKADVGAETTATGIVKGKYAYMAPEQIRAEKVDGRSDLYAVGVMAYELLTGIRPFRQKSPIDLMRAIVYTPAPSPRERAPWVHPELDAIVLKAMAKNPRERFQSAAEMSEALDRVLRTHEGAPSRGAIASLFKQLFASPGHGTPAHQHQAQSDPNVQSSAVGSNLDKPAPPRATPDVSVAQDSIVELSPDELSSVYDEGINIDPAKGGEQGPVKQAEGRAATDGSEVDSEAFDAGWLTPGVDAGEADFAWQLPRLALTGQNVVELPEPASPVVEKVSTATGIAEAVADEHDAVQAPPSPQADDAADSSTPSRNFDKVTAQPVEDEHDAVQAPPSPQVDDVADASTPSTDFENVDTDNQNSGRLWDAAVRRTRKPVRRDVAKLFDASSSKSQDDQDIASDTTEPKHDSQRRPSAWDLAVGSRGRDAGSQSKNVPKQFKPAESNPSKAAEAFAEGLACYRAGRYGEARKAWERACELAPRNRSYASSLRRLRRMLEPEKPPKKRPTNK